MAYFFNDVTQNMILFSNYYPNCSSNFEIDDNQLPYMTSKAVKYDIYINQYNKKVRDKSKEIGDYLSQNNKSNNDYNVYNQKLKDTEDQDKIFFTYASSQNYFVEQKYIIVDYLNMINDYSQDFNNNVFEYYLMTQHLEPYSCCFLETFRLLSIFSVRIINCEFFYCHFDKGVTQYVKDINDLDFDDEINDDNYEDNISKIKTYFNYRDNFMSDLKTFYDKIFDLIKDFSEFLANIKIAIKMISIVSIVVNSKSNDATLLKNQVNSLNNLTKSNDIKSSPPLQQGYYRQMVDKYQKEVLPSIIDMKINVNKKGTLTLLEKEKLNKLMIVFSLSSTGLIEHCNDLNTTLSSYNSNYKEDKIKYFNDNPDKKEAFIDKQELPNNAGINQCYVINYEE